MDWKYCLDCKYCEKHSCMLYGMVDPKYIGVCPLDTPYYNSSEINELQQFMIETAPIAYTKWVSKYKPIGPGDKVVTLRSGFGGNAGQVLIILGEINKKCWNARRLKDDGKRYCISKDTWWNDVVRLDCSVSEMIEEIKLMEEVLGPDRYSDDVYEGFKRDICYYCMNQTQCPGTKEDMFNCPKFQNYYLI